MKMGFNLTLEQTQKLIMTQELQQAIKILQLSSLELREYIQQQLETNPLIETKEEDPESSASVSDESIISRLIKNMEYNKWEYEYQEDNDNDYSYENYVANETTLRDHLLFQLHVTILSDMHRRIGEYIIESLDDNGYLTATIEEISSEVKADAEEVQKVLAIIQTFDPAGVACRSIKECLAVQLQIKGIDDPVVKEVVENHLENLADKRFNQIAKDLNISTADVQRIYDLIKTLEPKPGRAFNSSTNIKYINPDVIVKQVDDEFLVMVNDSTAPRLIINSYYRNILNNCEDQPNTSKYITSKLEAALWLIRSIEQRRMTLYKVVNAIVEYQKDFFLNGIRHLKPLTLKDIANKVGVHESTVSRATNGKYVETPRGIFELKFFFTSGVNSVFGEEISSESIKEVIKEMIDGEDPYKPVSDQKITDILNSRGINISRRTVAKYRDELGIQSSSRRKRY
ncbi:MAG: RNA polymerase sigma-54 factor RpoN [Firmicutes bacterium]|nr:RNA polymerase sigma-54 factor RpoN [Bacillota bacterium]MDI6704961.1 RNA polymerase factor sigma-54 [Bacillota bacterium]